MKKAHLYGKAAPPELLLLVCFFSLFLTGLETHEDEEKCMHGITWQSLTLLDMLPMPEMAAFLHKLLRPQRYSCVESWLVLS